MRVGGGEARPFPNMGLGLPAADRSFTPRPSPLFEGRAGGTEDENEDLITRVISWMQCKERLSTTLILVHRRKGGN
ncbi:hypothetical protein D477_002446 [Arthrobacter crystallopoietes BAB-32]|uniref:Uncharacterized protein n=1 Tax=Arthrobacter crystallopoietes BAB-32 TaxID=1246476 RepID=N1VC17_9MICC|nr:hypothetical protein D477_002446 [Arthrobacter crystallopoietes BAB-32]